MELVNDYIFWEMHPDFKIAHTFNEFCLLNVQSKGIVDNEGQRSKKENNHWACI